MKQPLKGISPLSFYGSAIIAIGRWRVRRVPGAHDAHRQQQTPQYR
ncbi:hypothetical protein PT7_2703 [Pusillimonas sp. T7-7]|nr:hypothetical protein PT7_2703 [Pusillimonas sp. T7-7]